MRALVMLLILLAGCTNGPTEASEADETAQGEAPGMADNDPATPAVLADGSTCVASQSVLDEAGDVSWRAAPLPMGDEAAMDLLSVTLQQTSLGMQFEVELAADPRASEGHYYYWFSFDDAPAAGGGNPPTWTIQGDDTYTNIVSMYFDQRNTYTGTWIDSTLSFTIPWEDLRAEYGSSWPVTLGAPSATSSGPHTGVQPQVDYVVGLANGNDWADNGRDAKGMTICPAFV